MAPGPHWLTSCSTLVCPGWKVTVVLPAPKIPPLGLGAPGFAGRGAPSPCALLNTVWVKFPLVESNVWSVPTGATICAVVEKLTYAPREDTGLLLAPEPRSKYMESPGYPLRLWTGRFCTAHCPLDRTTFTNPELAPRLEFSVA